MERNAIISVDCNGKILAADRNFTEIFGYTLHEILNTNVKLLFSTPNREKFESLTERKSQINFKSLLGCTHQSEALHKDHSVFAIQFTVNEVFTDRRTSIPIYLFILRQPILIRPMIALDSQQHIEQMNESSAILFGYRPFEVVGKSITFLLLKNFDCEKLPIDIFDCSNRIFSAIGLHENGFGIPLSIEIQKNTKTNGSLIFIDQILDKKDSINTIDNEMNEQEGLLMIDDKFTIVSYNQTVIQRLFGYYNTELIGNSIVSVMPLIDLSLFQRRLVSNDHSDHQKHHHQQVVEAVNFVHKDRSMIEVEYQWCSLIKENRLYFLISIQFKNGIRQLNRQSIDSVDESSPTCDRCKSTCNSGDSTLPVSDGISGNCGCSIQNQKPTYIGPYRIVEQIGKGNFGHVYHAVHHLSNLSVAIKVLEKSEMDQNDYERSCREIAILKTVNHPNIAKLYEVYETQGHLNIVLEYCCNGDLKNYVRLKKGLNENESRRIFKQILSAMAYCHENNIVHRDIKHENILLDQNNNVKLIDFGLSNYIQIVGSTGLHSSFCGTPAYASPEMILSKSYIGPEVDIWSVGVVLFCMLTSQYPFRRIADISSCNYQVPDWFSPCLCDLFRNIFTLEPEQRISIDNLIQHPWLVDGVVNFKFTSIEVVMTGNQLANQTTTTTTGNAENSLTTMNSPENAIAVSSD